MAFGFSAFEKGIAFPITADLSGLKAGLGQAQAELDKTLGMSSKSMENIGTKATIAGGAIVGAFGLATKSSADFETGMTEVFTLLPGLSADARDQMTEDVRAFSSEMGTTTDKTVPALYQAISAGVPKENVFEFLRTANQAAIGGVTDLEVAVDGITSVVNAYGTDVISASKASDLMFTAVKLGKTNFEELSSSLFQVIPPASALGVEFGDVTAAISSMTAQGTPTKVASTQLRQALVELSKDGGKASDAFKELSGKSFKEFIASGGNLQDALQIMETGAADMGVGINDLFGSVEAGNAVLALTGKGTEKFKSDLEAMSTAVGATEEAFNTMDETTGRSIDKLMASFEELTLEIGDIFLPILQEHIIPLLKDVLGIFDGLPDWIKPVIVMIGGLGAALVIIGPLLVALPAIIAAITTAFTILSLHPIILVIGGLILLVIWLESEFGILTKAAEVLSDGWGWLTDNVITPFVDWMTKATEGVDWLGTAMKLLLGPIGWVMIAMDHFGISWEDIWNGMMSVMGSAAGFIKGIFDTIIGNFKFMANMVIDGVNVMIRALNRIRVDVPSWIPGIGGQSFGFNVPEIPRLAEGGIVTKPTIAMIGEAGPEAIVPLDRGGGVPGDITITGNTFNVRNDQDIKLIAQELQGLITRNNRARGIL